jgi:hypothetical protein
MEAETEVRAEVKMVGGNREADGGEPRRQKGWDDRTNKTRKRAGRIHQAKKLGEEAHCVTEVTMCKGVWCFFLFVDTSVFLRLVFCIDIRAVICVFL